ncbi:hypothetical protein Cob_v000382 [Colletotrichum orbiculare MAFF 240422]|uniref:Uncharacterized protein n=1 Tax=Colletotrichum orbiculare (strain 104-T / ATCC 96160 / CBS 514.97 / LARS 414 / MAFF 240422) TaxID=1213857 RepID=A0A484G9L6_COLOR|nr:hypothetical protein Cob_v000382 [Colletotrichum orbiculare MAFF 240422]
MHFLYCACDMSIALHGLSEDLAKIAHNQTQIGRELRLLTQLPSIEMSLNKLTVINEHIADLTIGRGRKNKSASQTENPFPWTSTAMSRTRLACLASHKNLLKRYSEMMRADEEIGLESIDFMVFVDDFLGENSTLTSSIRVLEICDNRYRSSRAILTLSTSIESVTIFDSLPMPTGYCD